MNDTAAYNPYTAQTLEQEAYDAIGYTVKLTKSNDQFGVLTCDGTSMEVTRWGGDLEAARNFYGEEKERLALDNMEKHLEDC